MNRMEEYKTLMAQLNDIPTKSSGAVRRAKARRNREKFLWKPMASLASALAIFVGLVNLSPSVAAACRQLPFLDQLVEAVSFSKSLEKAVENEYAQPINQEQTQNDITARVEYLIVDSKQVNIFCNLNSEKYPNLRMDYDLFNEEGQRLKSLESMNTSSDPWLCVTANFLASDVPEKLQLVLKPYAVPDMNGREPTASVDALYEEEQQDYLAEFRFFVELDPNFTKAGKILNINRSVELNGQTIYIPQLEIYPSHIRIHTYEDEANTASLKSLDFYLELEDGTKIEPGSNGLISFASLDGKENIYIAESSYFYEADVFNLVVTGANFLEKGKEQIHMDLAAGKTDPLPEHIEFSEAEKTQWGWKVTFRVSSKWNCNRNTFAGVYSAEKDGTEEQIYRTAYTMSDSEAGENWSNEAYYLDDYDRDEVWMRLDFDQIWQPEEAVVVKIQP